METSTAAGASSIIPAIVTISRFASSDRPSIAALVSSESAACVSSGKDEAPPPIASGYFVGVLWFVLKSLLRAGRTLDRVVTGTSYRATHVKQSKRTTVAGATCETCSTHSSALSSQGLRDYFLRQLRNEPS